MQPITPINRKRLRFSEHDELLLLREVLGYNPFANPNIWDIIQEHIQAVTGKSFSIRSLKDHIDLLIKLWLKEWEILKGKSGIEVERTEKFVLCEEVHSLTKEFSAKKKNSKKPVEKSKLIGIESRERIAQTFYQRKENIKKKPSNSPENTEPEISIQEWRIFDHDYSDNLSPRNEDIVIQYDNTVENDPPSGAVMTNVSTILGPFKEVTNNQHQEHITTKIARGNSKPHSSKSNVLARNKARIRRSSIQKQGLAYLEEYDKSKIEMKKKDQQLEEKKIKLEENKFELEKKRLEIEERKVALMEYETKKNIEYQENRFQELNKIIINQERLINLIISKIP